jgi:hypothetical protein
VLHAIPIWLLVAALAGAGVANVLDVAGAKAGFVRWGYPAWWNAVTGGLEMVAAALVALPTSREAGLVLGALIILAAVLTVVLHREFQHLAPLGVFAALLAVVQFWV